MTTPSVVVSTDKSGLNSKSASSAKASANRQ
jgi:hypothetical protein